MAIHLHRARMMNEGNIGALLFPDVKKKYDGEKKYFFRLPKDYHKENMSKMRKKEHDLQSKIEEERNQPKSKFLYSS